LLDFQKFASILFITNNNCDAITIKATHKAPGCGNDSDGRERVNTRYTSEKRYECRAKLNKLCQSSYDRQSGIDFLNGCKCVRIIFCWIIPPGKERSQFQFVITASKQQEVYYHNYRKSSKTQQPTNIVPLKNKFNKIKRKADAD